MALMKKTREDLEWPTWFGQRLVDWPEAWKSLADATLKVEEFEDDGHLVVRAEMPGIDPDKDVEITVTDHTLHVRAERRSESTTDDKKGYRSEFRYGLFTRSLRLPTGASDTDINASYHDGILEIRVPIDSAEAEAKRIPIQRT